MKTDSVTFLRLSVRNLFRWFDERRLAVPEIQREFVWNAKRACCLLDSIYEGYPIGSAMVWETDRQNKDLLRHADLHVLPAFDPVQNHKILFLIDGQQRLSVLHQVRRGENILNSSGREIRFGDIYFSVDEDDQNFLYLRRPDPAFHFKVSTILSENWDHAFRRLPRYKKARIKECHQRLMDYRMQVVVTHFKELADVRETFIRINSQGMRVTEADRAFTSASRVRPRHRFRQLCGRLTNGFAGLKQPVYWTTLSLVRGIEDLGQNAFRRLTKEIRETDEGERWFERHEPKIGESIKLACDHFVNQLGVFDCRLLPYENMVALLAVFFYWNNRAQPNRVQREQIRRWFWYTGVVKRYAGSGYRRNILEDAAFFKSLGRNRRGRYQIAERAPSHALVVESYRASSALSRSYKLLLSHQKPRYLTNGEVMPLGPVAAAGNQKDLHHIWPRNLLSRHGVSARHYNCLCNICYLVAHDNRSFGHAHPLRYLDEYRRQRHFARALRSHLIPHDLRSPLWDEDVKKGFKQFVEARRQWLQRAFNDEAGARLFES